jgi:hypothetical protein
MRPLFVLGSRIFLVIVGGLCSSLLLRTLASRLTRGTGEAGRRAAKAATWRPLGVMGVWLVGFIGYAVLGVYAFNRLPGGSRVPPRSSTGYTLEEDAPNFGSIYPPNHLYGPLPSEDRISIFKLMEAGQRVRQRCRLILGWGVIQIRVTFTSFSICGTETKPSTAPWEH